MAGKIPHDDLTQRPVHVTYRLKDSIPSAVLGQLRLRRDQKLSATMASVAGLPEGLREQELHKQNFLINAQYELAIETALHKRRAGSPYYLADVGIAKIVADSWLFLQGRGLLYVYALCVMGNHVHLVARAPEGVEDSSLGDLVGKHKGYTALQINKQLDRTGSIFWEPGYFDRRVRTGKFTTVMWYVLNNPVKAGLVTDWRQWHGTYLNPDFDSLFR